MGFTTSCKLIAALADSESGGSAYVDDALRRRQIVLSYTDVAAADVGQVSFGPLPYGVKINLAKFLPTKALTAHDTTYATIAIGWDDGAAGGVTAFQTLTTKATGGTGNWVAGTAIALASLTPANTVAAGAYLTVTVAKASTGVVCDFRVLLDVDYEGA
ncbi:MAG: hypothetical protein WC700_10420 [Gemmatimonadaceae bacterium]|jgi:hypothetical protein